MSQWTVQNVSERNSKAKRVKSTAHAIELLMFESGKFEQAPTLDFVHEERGYITITAGFASGHIAFEPDFDPQGRNGSRNVKSALLEGSVQDDLETYDECCGASCIDAALLIPITEVIKVLAYALDHHDFAPFVDWRPGA